MPLEPILVGVSGGPDSICLLDLLIRSGKKVIVAHFNHQLRPGSGLEAERIRLTSEKQGVPFVVGNRDVKVYSIENKLSVEEAARILRYEFLFQQARQHGAPAVAVAHNADDQVETVLMHFLRGSGLSGLKGMVPVTRLPQFDPDILLIRPLLNIWRSEIEHYCLENGLDPIRDQSNLDQTFFRNRLRHSLIPELEKYNPGLKKVLLRSSESLSGDLDLVNAAVDEIWESLDVRIGDGFISLNQEILRNQTRGLQRNIIRRIINLFKPELRDVGFDTVDRTINFLLQGSNSRKKIDFSGGIEVSQESGKLIFSDSSVELTRVDLPQAILEQEIHLGIPLQLEGGWCMIAEKTSSFEINGILENQDPFQTWLDADLVAGELHIRGKKNGDRFQPLGMTVGSIKVSDLFINEKIPYWARPYWPLVCSKDEILWVPGVRSAHRYRVTETTTELIHLRLSRSTVLD